ncbi:MAG: SufE family protein [Synechococcaceae bacterium WBB_3_034]|nr:SufE family protein [Synechococcaceae bacterium WBB_3_034]
MGRTIRCGLLALAPLLWAGLTTGSALAHGIESRLSPLRGLSDALLLQSQFSNGEPTRDGCVSQVYVVGQLVEGKLHWQGDSDAAITKGLLALLIEGLEGLDPATAAAIDASVLAETGLQASLTPSRANGFLNILRLMQAQAKALADF